MRGNPIFSFCRIRLSTIEFYRVFPDRDKPSCSGYLFISSHTKEELCELIIDWYSGKEVELLT